MHSSGRSRHGASAHRRQQRKAQRGLTHHVLPFSGAVASSRTCSSSASERSRRGANAAENSYGHARKILEFSLAYGSGSGGGGGGQSGLDVITGTADQLRAYILLRNFTVYPEEAILDVYPWVGNRSAPPTSDNHSVLSDWPPERVEGREEVRRRPADELAEKQRVQRRRRLPQVVAAADPLPPSTPM
jgi:hypothetical protein